MKRPSLPLLILALWDFAGSRYRSPQLVEGAARQTPTSWGLRLAPHANSQRPLILSLRFRLQRLKWKLADMVSQHLPLPACTGLGRSKGIRVHHRGGRSEVGGPAVKLWRMQQYFPDSPFRFNIIYSVSARVPASVCRRAQARGVKVVCHVNSVWHPAYCPDYAERNAPIAEVHALADHVVYGSEHARQAAIRYLGPTPCPYTIIYNGVDTQHFRPPGRRDPDRFNVLAIGLHYIRHRLEPLIRAMPYVLHRYPQAKLVIAGPLIPGEGIFDCGRESIRAVIKEVGLEGVEFLGRYTQQEAPGIYAQGDVLVHLKHMDWTPNTVIEGMACGLPILHAGNGGMNELVKEAGLSLGLPFDWDRIHTPEPEILAEWIIELYERRWVMGPKARQIAVERYDIEDWVAAHQRIFEKLLSKPVLRSAEV